MSRSVRAIANIDIHEDDRVIVIDSINVNNIEIIIQNGKRSKFGMPCNREALSL